MSLIEVGERAPEPVKRAGGAAYVHLKQALGQNYYEYEYNGTSFKFEYSTPQQLGKLGDLVGADGSGPEGVPMSVLDVEGHDAIIDIGAHFGVYSVIFGALCLDTDLYSFEPNDYNRAVLERNLHVNGIDAEVSEKVVSDQTGTILFYEDKDMEGSIQDTAIPDSEDRFTRIERESIALSDLFEREGIKCPFVKIDAEGAEQDILPDLLDVADLNRLSGIVELHNGWLEGGPREILDLLNEGGFEYRCIKEEPSNRKAYHFRPSR